MPERYLTYCQIAIGFFVGGYISIFAHELGHALIGRWMGYQITSFGMGLARPLIVFDWGSTRVYFCWKDAALGFAFNLPADGQTTKAQAAAYLLGGILANLLIMLVGLAVWLWLDWGAALWITIVVGNGLMVLDCLIPHAYPVAGLPTANDGRQLVQLFTGESADAFGVLQGLHQFGRLWKEIGDYRMQACYLRGAASVWGTLGDADYARELLRQAEALGAPHLPVLDAIAILEEGEAHHKAGELDAAANAYEKARDEFAAQSARHGQICAIMNLAQLAEEQGKPDEADRLFNEIEGQPWMAESPDSRESWLGCRLKAVGKRLSLDQLKQLRTDYESLPARPIPEVSDWHFYPKLARVHITREEWTAAEEPCDLACKAALKLWQALPSVDDRKRFANVVAEFQQQSCDLLTRLGKEEAAATIAALFQEKDDTLAKRAANEARRQRDSKLYRWGIALTAANLFAMAATIWLLVYGVSNFNFAVALVSLNALLGVFLGGALAYHILYALSRACGAHDKQTPGSAILGLALSPWLIFLSVLIVVSVLRYVV